MLRSWDSGNKVEVQTALILIKGKLEGLKAEEWSEVGFHSSTLTDVRREVRPQKREHKTHLHFSLPSQCQLPRWQRQKNKWNGWWMRAVKCCPHVSCLSILYGQQQQQAADGQTWYVSVCQLVMWKWNEKWRRTARNLRSSNCKSIWPPGQASTAKAREAKRKSAGKQKGKTCHVSFERMPKMQSLKIFSFSIFFRLLLTY